MGLQQDTYKALEAVVGSANISDDPAILDSYAWRSGLAAGMYKFADRFEAITLPKDVREVQEIVKLCNRHRIQFKASSTGWGPMNDPSGPGVIKLDLRRMNHIIEINEQNMYAVVEPYVSGAQLQAELMKKGLHCNVTGAGGQCSALSLAAHENIGHLGQTTSCGERNQLALEWVTPEGDIVQFGSMGSAGEWFCGDGPGPSLRGIIRGPITPIGGLGVFTKSAMKIYHWPGPAAVPIEGISPHYYVTEMPERFLLRYLSFPSLRQRSEALRKIGESEIAFEVMGFAPSMISANIASSNSEDLEYLDRIRKEVQGPGLQIIVAGNSGNDFEYKKKVLNQIMIETSAKSLALMEDTIIGGSQMWRCIRITGSIRETMRASGVFGGVVGGTDTLELMLNYIQSTLPYKKELIRKGLVFDDGAEAFVQPFEHGHYGHAELLIRYSLSNPETPQAMGHFMSDTTMVALNNRFGVPHQVWGNDANNLYGPHSSNFQHWLRKIKQAFDPNEASDGRAVYISGKE
jgi:glycolate oxidase